MTKEKRPESEKYKDYDSPRTHRGQQLENPPKGYEEGFSNLIWNLRAYGFPITMESVIYVREYLENQDITPEEADYQTVAQSISQNYDIEFETNNHYGTKQLRFFDFS